MFPSWWTSAADGNVVVCAKFIAAGQAVDAVYRDRTALHLAVENGRVQVGLPLRA
jgi:hypothetical protein